MKKLIVICLFASAFASANAQIQNLGVRLGFGGEISAQTSGDNGRMEFDLGLYRNYSSFTLGYHFVNKLEGDFKWYYGIGGTVGYEDDFGISTGPVGILGLEYNFNAVPIQLAIDYRPAFYIITSGAVDFHSDFTAAGFAVRYIF